MTFRPVVPARACSAGDMLTMRIDATDDQITTNHSHKHHNHKEPFAC